jgi:hypothetical protein
MRRADVWFAEFKPDGKIGMVDPRTLKVTIHRRRVLGHDDCR